MCHIQHHTCNNTAPTKLTPSQQPTLRATLLAPLITGLCGDAPPAAVEGKEKEEKDEREEEEEEDELFDEVGRDDVTVSDGLELLLLLPLVPLLLRPPLLPLLLLLLLEDDGAGSVCGAAYGTHTLDWLYAGGWAYPAGSTWNCTHECTVLSHVCSSRSVYCERRKGRLASTV